MGFDDFICGIISVAMVMATISLQYEIKRHIWIILPRLKRRPRLMINVFVLALLAGAYAQRMDVRPDVLAAGHEARYSRSGRPA